MRRQRGWVGDDLYDDDGYDEPPINFGQGALHMLREAGPDEKRRKRKKHPLGFHIPKKP